MHDVSTNQPERAEVAAPAAKDWTSPSRMKALVLFVLTAAGLGICIWMAFPFVPALAWALAFAVFFLPLQVWLEGKMKNRSLAALIAVALIVVMIAGPAAFVVQRLVVEARNGAEFVSKSVTTGEWRRDLEAHPTVGPIIRTVSEQMDLAGAEKDAAGRLSGMGTMVNGTVSRLLTFCLTFYLLFFFLRDRKEALEMLCMLSPLRDKDMDDLFRRVSDTIYATVYGTLAVSSVQGFLGGLMFWWLGLPAPFLWGVVMTLLAIVPVLGAFVVWVPAALYLLATGHWGQAMILTAWGMLVVGTIDNLLRPLFVAGRLQQHTVLVFISIVGGLFVFGASGLILGPVLLTITMLLLEVWKRRSDEEEVIMSDDDKKNRIIV
ncbi:MAG: AI-2E family transporter [Candidatus Methylacidiphilales bacterium]|nr:AI-2E family transporter [Candidatus Methylacidiphilales bacterium]